MLYYEWIENKTRKSVSEDDEEDEPEHKKMRYISNRKFYVVSDET